MGKPSCYEHHVICPSDRGNSLEDPTVFVRSVITLDQPKVSSEFRTLFALTTQFTEAKTTTEYTLTASFSGDQIQSTHVGMV